MHFSLRRKVMFRDCDPAGRVFYPRYFEMINDCVECFFAEAIGWPFEAVHPAAAVPTARIEAVFPAPSHHGDMLDFTLSCRRIGRSSLSLLLRAGCAGQTRLQARATLVHVDGGGRPAPWPAPVRDALQPYLEEAEP